MAFRPVHVATDGEHPLAQRVEIGPHHFLADEPSEHGGEDLGPAPPEWLLAGLGSCTSMTLTLYAKAKKWPLEKVDVEVSGQFDKGVLSLTRKIVAHGPLSAEQHQRLLEIANKCPVHKMLSGETKIDSTLNGPQTAA